MTVVLQRPVQEGEWPPLPPCEPYPELYLAQKSHSSRGRSTTGSDRLAFVRCRRSGNPRTV